MNVFDAKKLKLDILIKCLVLVALASRSIGHCIDAWSCVDDIHEVATWICVANGLQHLFVFEAASTETRQRLTASTNRRLIRMQISQNGQTRFRSKAWTSQQHCRGCLEWNVNLSWIWKFKIHSKFDRSIEIQPIKLTGVAQFVRFVHIVQRPFVVRNSHSLKFSFQRKEIPSGWFDEFVWTRFVMETIQALNVYRLTEFQQCHVHIMAFLFTWNHKSDKQKCFAANLNWRTGRGQWQFFDVTDVHVQNLIEWKQQNWQTENRMAVTRHSPKSLCRSNQRKWCVSLWCIIFQRLDSSDYNGLSSERHQPVARAHMR